MEVAHGPAFWNDYFCLFSGVFNLSNIVLVKLLQTILVIFSGASALIFLFRKVLFKKKATNNKHCDSDCDCH